jgi:arylsulfatase A-like enzyme
VFGDAISARRVVAELPRCELMDRRRAVIADGYKIIGFGNDSRFELYHLDQDPTEEHDLAEERPKVLEKMKQVYAEVSREIPVVEIVGHATLKGAPPGQRW